MVFWKVEKKTMIWMIFDMLETFCQTKPKIKWPIKGPKTHYPNFKECISWLHTPLVVYSKGGKGLFLQMIPLILLVCGVVDYNTQRNISLPFHINFIIAFRLWMLCVLFWKQTPPYESQQ
jgi:hypothetical protein